MEMDFLTNIDEKEVLFVENKFKDTIEDKQKGEFWKKKNI